MKSLNSFAGLGAGLVVAVAIAAAFSWVAPAIPVVLALALVAVALLAHFDRNPLRPWQLAIWAFVFAFGALALICGASMTEVGMGVLLANGAPALELKQVEDAIAKATTQVKATTDRMQQALDQAINDVKRLETVQGKTNDELKTASDLATKAQTELKGFMDRLLEIEQKAAKRLTGGEPEVKSWGQIVTESEQWKACKDSNGRMRDMQPVEVGSWHKAPIYSNLNQTTTGTVPYLTSAERAPFVAGTERQLVVRSLLPVYSTESNVVEFARENVFTNAAAPQGAGASPSADGEGQSKAESSLTFTFVQAPIVTIAHWIPASRQILSDAKMLQSYIEQRLRYGVLLEEEDEVINSSGTNGELNGLWNQATAYDRNATADNRLDTLLKAFLQVTLSDYTADGAVMSWVDWTELLLLKDTQGRYLFGDPTGMQAPRVWGRPVVPTNSMTVGRFMVGAFQLSAALWDREQATVRVSEHHDKFFIQNMVALLAEERVVLTVYRPAAIIKGNFQIAGQPN